MQILEPKNSIVYGPVNSRRLGKSLGVNIFPKGIKYCTFNCVYCHYGWTKFNIGKDTLPDGCTFPLVSEVKKVLEERLQYLKANDDLPAYITFSGNGEPTLHPDFVKMVNVINEVRDEFAPDAKTAILSNSTEVHSKEIIDSLCLLDLRIMKLDCGNSLVFEKYNKPYPEISLDKIVEGLVYLSHQRAIYIQTLFAAGTCGNLSEESIDSWISDMGKIKPEMVQIYTLNRGYPEKEIEPAVNEYLLKVHLLLNKKGIASIIY